MLEACERDRRPSKSPHDTVCHCWLVQQCERGQTTLREHTRKPASNDSVQPPRTSPRCARLAVQSRDTRFRAQPQSMTASRAIRNPRSHPRAKKARSNFPHFDFSKRGICALHRSKTGAQADLGFRTVFARVSHLFRVLHPRCRVPRPVFVPPKQPGIQHRRFSQCHCNKRATNRCLLKETCGDTDQ
jgi:hypothetical protein